MKMSAYVTACEFEVSLEQAVGMLSLWVYSPVPSEWASSGEGRSHTSHG